MQKEVSSTERKVVLGKLDSHMEKNEINYMYQCTIIFSSIPLMLKLYILWVLRSL